MKKVILLFVFCLAFAASYAQEVFKGEEAVKDCQIELKIKYVNTKKDLKYAEPYNGKEIIWVTKSKGTYTVQRMYLVIEEVKGEKYIYLTPKDKYEAGQKEAVFIKFKSKKFKFYLAECYDGK